MSHDAKLVAKVAETLNEEGAAPGSSLHSWRCEHPDRYGECDCVAETARAVLDALDLPGLIRAAKAEALTEAADDMERIFRAGNLLGGPTDDWLRARAAEIDPEEGDHE